MDIQALAPLAEFAGSDRVVVDLASRRPQAQPQPEPPATLRADPEASRVFAAKIELGAAVMEALSAEAKCVRTRLPPDTIERLARCEAALEMLAHDIREAGGAHG
jgi:hypothetical protein